MLHSLRVVERHQSWFVGTFAVVATAGLLTCTSLVKPRTATTEIEVGHYSPFSQPAPSDDRICLRALPSIERDLIVANSPEFSRRVARRCAVAPGSFELAAEPAPVEGNLRLRVTSRPSTSAKRLADVAAAEFVQIREEARGGAYQQTMNFLTRMEAESRQRLTVLKRRPRWNEVDRLSYCQAQKAQEAYAAKLAELRPGRDVFGPRARVVSWSRERGAANAPLFVGGWLLGALVIALGVVQLRDRGTTTPE